MAVLLAAVIPIAILLGASALAADLLAPIFDISRYVVFVVLVSSQLAALVAMAVRFRSQPSHD